MLLFFYFCQASQVYRSVMSRAHPLIFFFSLLPLHHPPHAPRGPKSKGSSRCLVYPTKKEKKRKRRTKIHKQLRLQRERQHFWSCVVYIYWVLLTWHACWNDSQIICICLVERKETGSTLRLWTDSTGGYGSRLSIFCAKSGTWHTLVTPTAADDAAHCPSNLGIGYKHLCFCHPQIWFKNPTAAFRWRSLFTFLFFHCIVVPAGRFAMRRNVHSKILLIGSLHHGLEKFQTNCKDLGVILYCKNSSITARENDYFCSGKLKRTATPVSAEDTWVWKIVPLQKVLKRKKKIKVLFNFFSSEKNYTGVPKNIVKKVENASWYSKWVISSLLVIVYFSYLRWIVAWLLTLARLTMSNSMGKVRFSLINKCRCIIIFWGPKHCTLQKRAGFGVSAWIQIKSDSNIQSIFQPLIYSWTHPLPG